VNVDHPADFRMIVEQPDHVARLGLRGRAVAAIDLRIARVARRGDLGIGGELDRVVPQEGEVAVEIGPAATGAAVAVRGVSVLAPHRVAGLHEMPSIGVDARHDVERERGEQLGDVAGGEVAAAIAQPRSAHLRLQQVGAESDQQIGRHQFAGMHPAKEQRSRACILRADPQRADPAPLVRQVGKLDALAGGGIGAGESFDGRLDLGNIHVRHNLAPQSKKTRRNYSLMPNPRGTPARAAKRLEREASLCRARPSALALWRRVTRTDGAARADCSLRISGSLA
jgi:hypothetical protein